jgi:hypothetical protein
MTHSLPFQRSASVSAPLMPPTAVHALADVHETPDSALPYGPCPIGVGVYRIDQYVPSQRYANVFWFPLLALAVYGPTAMHAPGDVHETPDRLLV